MRSHLFESCLLELVERDAWLDLFAAAPEGCVQKFGIGSQRLGNMGLLACREIPIIEFNRAMSVGIVAPTTETELDQTLAWLKARAAPGWALQVSPPARTKTMEEWLRSRAFSVSGTGWTKFKRGTSPVAHVPTPGIQVRSVNTGSAEAFGHVVQAGFGLPVGSAKWFAGLVGRPGWHLYLAYEGKTPIACGAAFVGRGVAWHGIDATLGEFRRRGAQTALIGRRIADGCTAEFIAFTAETGQPPVGQEAAYPSYRNYSRAGFTPAYVRGNYKPA